MRRKGTRKALDCISSRFKLIRHHPFSTSHNQQIKRSTASRITVSSTCRLLQWNGLKRVGLRSSEGTCHLLLFSIQITTRPIADQSLDTARGPVNRNSPSIPAAISQASVPSASNAPAKDHQHRRPSPSAYSVCPTDSESLTQHEDSHRSPTHHAPGPSCPDDSDSS
jgi:hypothetical protein